MCIRDSLFHALFYVCLDLLAQRYVGQGLARPAQHEAQPGLHVDGLEDLQLLGRAEVGRVPGHISYLRGTADMAQCFCHGPGTPAEQDVLQDRAVLAGELDQGRRLRRFVDVVDLYPQRLAGAGHGAAQ